jgi:16S rRNA C1402 (ribose-2'-O) methylase RsmI
MNVLKLEKLSDITGRDSFIVLNNELNKQVEYWINDNEKGINEIYPSSIQNYEIKKMIDSNKEKNKIYDDAIKNLESLIQKAIAENEDLKNKKYMGSKVEKEYLYAEGYLKKQDEVLGSKYSCTYSIKNPLLGNAKQEITSIFILSPDNRVIRIEE